MKPDSLGFLYPYIDKTKCIECGLCVNICQFKKDYNRFDNFEKPEPFLMRLKDSKQLKQSQSGGVFYAVANMIINHKGVVYGAAFTSNWKVSHQKAQNINDLQKLRMSKYVQSDIRNVFIEIKRCLKSDTIVLFSGTPCQVSALRSYIPISLHKYLYCIDIICHGVPSPKIWEDYIKYLEQLRGLKLKKVCFRDKRYGWHGATESYVYENEMEEFRKTNNHLYFSGLTIRDSCSNCPYTNLKRIGDLSIGDFWGLPKDSPYEDDKGVSLVLVNSNKGQYMLKLAQEHCICESVTLDNCLQPQLVKPSVLNKNRDIFIKKYEQRGFKYIYTHYGDLSWRYKFNQILRHLKNRITYFYR